MLRLGRSHEHLAIGHGTDMEQAEVAWEVESNYLVRAGSDLTALSILA